MATPPLSSYGWGAAATLAKRKKATADQKKKTTGQTKKTGAYDPYGATGLTPTQQAIIDMQMQGPPQFSDDVNFAELRGIAAKRATSQFQPLINRVQDERGYQQGRQEVSQKAATNFAAALASMFTGGKTGAEAEQYSLENFGGSYLAGVAAHMGTQLMAQIGHTFSERDWQLKSQLDELFDKYPEQEEQAYKSLVEAEQERIKNGQSILDATYKEQLAALVAAERYQRQNRGDLLDATKALGGGKAANEPRVIQTRDSTFAIDPATGKVIWEKKNSPMPTATKNPVLRNFPDGSLRRWDPSSETWIIEGTKPKETPAEKNGKGTSPSTISTTTARAMKAGQAALEKVTDAIWAKMPNSGADPKEDPEGYASASDAYNAWLDSGKSFGTAMTRVIAAISPHLKAIGYTPKRIRLVAYQIVSAEIDPPKGYKGPGSK